MSSNIINEGSKNMKTKNTLYATMSSLLRKNSFRKVTIKRICEEALISRAAFYAHFIDKYDLLEHWLGRIWPENFNKDYTYEQIEEAINCRTQENTLILKNLLFDADEGTYDALFNYILSTVNLSVKKSCYEEKYLENIVLSNFYAGGILSYISWQIKNNFPSDVPPMNRCLYEIIKKLQDRQ